MIFHEMIHTAQLFSTLIRNEQQIIILEWFLKDQVTVKTGVMMLKIQLCITGINYILKYKTGILNCNINSQYQCIFDQINTGLLSITDFSKT